jgi:hypothetical protein
MGEVNAPIAAPVRRSLGEVPGSATQLRSLAVGETTTTLTAAESTDRFGEAESVFLPRSLRSSRLKGIFKIPKRQCADASVAGATIRTLIGGAQATGEGLPLGSPSRWLQPRGQSGLLTETDMNALVGLVPTLIDSVMPMPCRGSCTVPAQLLATPLTVQLFGTR